MHKTWQACSWGSGVSIHAHGEHPWMRMGTGYYCAGLGHEKEPRSATGGRCGSWVHARTAKDNHKTRLGDEGQGRLVESRVRTGDMLWGEKPPTKADKNMRKQTSKQNGKERTDNKHRHTNKNTTIQCIIYAIKNKKTTKNKAGKTKNTEEMQLSAPDTRKTKNARPKTRKNNKRTQPRTQQENKQRKQQHYFCSQKCCKRPKSKRKTANTRKKLFWTKSALRINRKSRKWHQEGKTVQRGRPTFSQASRQQGNNFFRFQF